MAKMKVSDFYYGAVLSMLFNNHFKPALVEGDDGRQVYDFTTDQGDIRLFIKYTKDKAKRKTIDYYSWTFGISETDKNEILKFISENYNLVLALVCGVSDLSESEIAFLKTEEIEELLIQYEKNSITINRKKNGHSYRIPTFGSRENSLLIKSNRFNDLFL